MGNDHHMKEAYIVNPATPGDLGIFLVCYIYEHFYCLKWAIGCVPLLEKTPVLGCWRLVIQRSFSNWSFWLWKSMFCMLFFFLSHLPQSVVWAFLSFPGYSLPRRSDLWRCTPVLWASGVCCDNANHQCLHLHQQHSAIRYWHIPVFGQQSSRPRCQEYWSHWTYCLGCVYWYYGGDRGNRDKETSVNDSASWANKVLWAYESTDIPWWGMGCLVGTVEVVEHTDFICRQCAMKFQNTVERKFLWSYWSCKEAGIKYKGILKGWTECKVFGT